MSTYFKKTFLLTEDEKQKVSEMGGKILLWILQGQSIGYMSENLKMYPWHVDANIDEMLYILRRRVGIKRYLRILFMK